MLFTMLVVLLSQLITLVLNAYRFIYINNINYNFHTFDGTLESAYAILVRLTEEPKGVVSLNIVNVEPVKLKTN